MNTLGLLQSPVVAIHSARVYTRRVWKAGRVYGIGLCAWLRRQIGGRREGGESVDGLLGAHLGGEGRGCGGHALVGGWGMRVWCGWGLRRCWWDGLVRRVRVEVWVREFVCGHSFTLLADQGGEGGAEGGVVPHRDAEGRVGVVRLRRVVRELGRVRPPKSEASVSKSTHRVCEQRPRTCVNEGGGSVNKATTVATHIWERRGRQCEQGLPVVWKRSFGGGRLEPSERLSGSRGERRLRAPLVSTS